MAYKAVIGKPSDQDDDPKAVNLHVAARIEFFRERQRLTQSELAIIIGVPVQKIQQYENGGIRVGASILMMLAGYFNVSPTSFFQDDADCDTLTLH